MTAFFGTWIKTLAGAAIVCAVATALTPEGKGRKVTAVVCGIVMMIALLSPIKSFDASAYGSALAKYSLEAQHVTGSAEKVNDRLSRTIIEDRCGAYILDKAEKSGIDLKAEVTARWDTREHLWYPYECHITGSGQNDTLADVIETELGIPKERQHWSENNE